MPHFAFGQSYGVVGVLAEAWLPPVLPIDRLTVSAHELTVKELRAVIVQAAQRSYGPGRLLLITDGEMLNDLHQNTLLKLLEEPSPTLVIIIQAQSLTGLLPTVRSRLSMHRAAAVSDPAAEPVFIDNQTAVQTRLQSLKSRPELLGLLRQEAGFQRGQFRLAGAPARVGWLERAITRLEHNANQKLTVDWLLLRWYGQTGKE